MLRLGSLVIVLVPAIATADSRLDLEPIPDLSLNEMMFHLDRFEGRSSRSSAGLLAEAGVGWGTHDDEKGVVGVGSLGVGKRLRRLLFAARSELAGSDHELLRGRHGALLELTADDRDRESLGGKLSLEAGIEHGAARGLAPVRLGPGRRVDAQGRARVLIRLAPDADDFMWAALVETDGGMTRWLDAPALDRARRGAVGLGLALAPNDGEVPRGRIDLLRARVEHGTITRPLRAAGTALRDTQVRAIEVMVGPKELTFHIDHEMLLAFTAQFGAAWLEADAATDRLHGTFYKMELASNAMWRASRSRRRQLGLALAREPGTTPDGQHLVSDWRLDLVTGAEDARFVLAASGGISWVGHKAGAGDPATMSRYGSHLEAFAKLAGGFQVGGYHVMVYEPKVAGDLFSSQRAWSSEIGVLLRWRSPQP